MKTFLAAAAVAGAMLAGTVAANAAIVPSGTADEFGNFSGGSTIKGAVTKYYEFTIPLLGSYTVTASVTTAPSSALTFSAFDFFSLGGMQIGPSGTAVGAGSKTFNIGAVPFAPGEYYVGVTSSGKGGYSGNIAAVSAVPLPTSVALFGVAIAGLGVAGAVGRKGRKTAAANA